MLDFYCGEIFEIETFLDFNIEKRFKFFTHVLYVIINLCSILFYLFSVKSAFLNRFMALF